VFKGYRVNCAGTRWGVITGADAGGVKRAPWNVEGDPPLAGCHYPASFTEFASWFTDEPHAVAYIEAVRFRQDWRVSGAR
jgi:hypothetical protein